jgi:hypothetical protein
MLVGLRRSSDCGKCWVRGQASYTDLPDVVPDCISTGLYADDTKLYRNVSTIGDCEKLQDALT